MKTYLHSIRWFFVCAFVLSGTLVYSNPLPPYPNPLGGALTGDRYRVIVSTDIGGDDEDDDQSMVHYLLYADLFDTEGIISSPPKAGRKKDILEVIDVYEKDFPKLKKYSKHYPTPEYLRSIAKQGATGPAPEAGFSKPTEGSKHIIECAHRDDPRPLYVLVWGSITDVAQALHDDPSIKEKIRVYFIASWNLQHDKNAFRYIDENHADAWTVFCDQTFLGWYMGGEQGVDLHNKNFVTEHIKNHGALGDYFAPLKNGAIKMGDTPSVAYLLRGDPSDPTKDHWGGRFVAKPGRPHWWEDDPNPDLVESDRRGAKTVNRWREDYLRDFERRMDRCLDKTGGDAYLFTSFRGNGEDGLHLAYSYDGYTWTDLGGSFLAPKVGVSVLMRDPCIKRAPDGTFHMVWTSGWEEKGIGYACSKDLIHWSEQKYIEVMKHEPEAQNTWAPELFYDEASKQYIIYWATTIPDRFPGDDGHGLGRNHRMYYVATPDFQTFSETKLFYDPGHSVIDCILVQRDGGYTLVLKDERRPMLCLRMAFSDSPTGPFTGITEPFTEQYCEGPSPLKIGDEWFVYFDMYHKHQYGAVKTKDFKTWTNLSGQVSFPKDHRHGTAIRVTEDVLEGLKRARR